MVYGLTQMRILTAALYASKDAKQTPSLPGKDSLGTTTEGSKVSIIPPAALNTVLIRHPQVHHLVDLPSSSSEDTLASKKQK